jgi:ABC-2 type transport system ATP-binding protein
MLEAVKLSKSFNGTTALEGLDLAIAPGEVLCLLGANGAGKTTTINLFLHFVEPTAGCARIGGLDVAAHPLATKRLVAYIPEQVMLYRNLTGLENLGYFSALAGRKLARQEVLELFERVGLPGEAADRRAPGRRRPRGGTRGQRRQDDGVRLLRGQLPQVGLRTARPARGEAV